MKVPFGEKLRKIMKSRGIKAITLAQRMGVSCAYVSQLITGIRRPGRETLLKLSKALEIPVETLLMLETEMSERMFISRKVPVMDESQITAWGDCVDLDYPSLVAKTFEYATTDDPNAFYLSTKGIASCAGLESCDLMLIEPGKEVKSGNTVFVWSSGMISIRKIVTKENIIILMDDKQEPIVFTPEHAKDDLKYYKVSQCIKKL
jgi:transcriptional regulator with XRE-family HTH domain